MTSSRRQEARRVFMEVADLPAEAQAAALEEACEGDAPLRTEVDALLHAEVRAGGFMADPTSDAAGAQEDGATIAATPREQVGELIGRYKLLEQIGEGGFGTVWAAEQREPVKRRVALKIIKLGMDTKQVIARFEAERQALALMDHPNIAKVLDAGATETGRPYFVMELVKGVPILEYCDTEKLDTKARLELFTKICHAIQHAHQKGIIHRDIKPSNVLITLHDGVPVPKVIDFGIAKATNQELTSRTIYTEHHQMIGTPAYMSPEQAEMSGLDIDTRSDIYALGVMLYELLTGTTPFDSESLMEAGFAEMMRIIREQEPHKPSTRLSSLGETGTRTAEQRRVDVTKLSTLLRGDLDWIVMKCLEKDRTRRYETANGLAADINRHLTDEPVLAGPPSTKYRLQKFVKRNRAQVIAGGVVTAALVLGVAGTSTGMVWALNERDRADTAATNASLAAEAEKEAKLDAQANERKAVEAAERAERELTRATEIKRLITQMLTSVDPENARGADVTLLKGILDDASDRLTSGEISDDLIAAELHAVVGDVYWRLGLYPQAAAHLPVALEIRSRALGEEHPDTLGSMMQLANVYHSQGRYTETEVLYLETLEAQRRVLGAEHPETLSSMSNLALLYRHCGRSAEAEPLLLDALSILMRTQGAEHRLTLEVRDNLTFLYTDQGRYTEAEPLQLETLKTWRRVMGDESPTTLVSMSNLANIYADQARYAEAEPLYVEVMETEKRVLGDEHPRTLESMNALAIMYAAQARYAEAEPLYVELIEIRTRVLGEEHPSTLGSITNLGLMYGSMGRYEDVATMLEQSLPIKRRVLGMQHPWTGSALHGLAAAYDLLGRRDEALPLWRDLLELQTASAASPDADAPTLNAAAWTLLTHDVEELRDPERALRYAERACAVEEAEGGASLSGYLDTLALAQHLTGDTVAAIETQKRAVNLAPDDEELKATLAKYEAALADETGDTRDDQR